MPSVTVNGSISPQQAATALQDKLGARYEVTTQGHDGHEAVKVRQSAVSTATVHVNPNGHATTFNVHGGGLVITRIVNELGIARQVVAAIEEAFGGF
ncbi:MAG TPA: hypothetical protein VMG38_19680 [Trebonia sp.]|nr:hypothetical protein [Trebonia sp.]